MKNLNINWKKVAVQTAILVGFLTIACIYCVPVFEGKTILGHDTESWAYSAKEARDYNATHDEPTLWTNSMFGGMPTYQITMPKSYNVVGYLQDLVQQLPTPVFFVFLYLVCFYIALLCFGISPWLAVAGSFAFTFASYNFIIIAAGHATKVVAIAYMAPLIGSIYVAFRRNRWVGALLTVIFLSLAIRANHVQILYYTLFILLFYGISEFIYSIKEKELKSFFTTFGVLCGAAVIAIGMNATMLLTTYEYSKYTMRGENNGLTITDAGKQQGLSKDYITAWSYGIDESMTLLIPNFMGGASVGTLPADSETGRKMKSMGVRNVEKTMKDFQLPLYWGKQQFTAGPVYFGAIVLFLFLVGCILVKGRMKWWSIAVATLMLLLSWGRNFMPLTELFIDYVPMYNKFRTVSMTLVATGFCVALLAILAVKELMSDEIDKSKKRKALYIAGGIMGGICLLFALIPSMAGSFVGTYDAQQFQGDYAFLRSTIIADRQHLLRMDALRSALFIGLAFALFFVASMRKLKKAWIYTILALLIVADMYPVCKRYLNNDNFVRKNMATLKKPSPADKAILADHDYFRVLDATVNIFNDASPAYFHKNIGGYHAAKLRRYQEIIDVYLANEIQEVLNAQTIGEIEDNLGNAPILNMLNMRYLIYNKEAMPITNPHANGAAWLVNHLVVANNADEEMLALGKMNIHQDAVIDKRYASDLQATATDSAAYIKLTKYEPNRLEYSYKSTEEQIAIFSEIFYDKGWNAYIDGEKHDYFRANYLLRAMCIPAGTHQIVWKFEPRSFTTGNTIAIICSILFLLMMIGAGFLHYKKLSWQSNRETLISNSVARMFV